MNSANILCIILSGLIMSLLGVVLYAFNSHPIAPLRYFLPIPPIAVASYVFVFNLMKDYDGLPDNMLLLANEAAKSTLVAGTLFGLITSLIMIAIKLIKVF